MNIKRSTQIPNTFFDVVLSKLSLAELKLLLLIYRQTNGWIDQHTGKRKKRDWITHRFFKSKTGLSRQTISKTLDKLSHLGFLTISDFHNVPLKTAEKRRGKTKLFYAVNPLEHIGLFNPTCKVSSGQHVRLVVHNKTNSQKEKKTKGFKSLKDILKRLSQ